MLFLRKSYSGQNLGEYAIIGALVVLACIGALAQLNTALDTGIRTSLGSMAGGGGGGTGGGGGSATSNGGGNGTAAGGSGSGNGWR